MRKLISLAILSCFSVPASAAQNGYPTVEIVENVVSCMHNIGEQTEETLYTCACRFDVVAREMPFDEYEQGSVSARFRQMPGEKGGLFRDAKEQKTLADKLDKIMLQAVKDCPVVRRVSRP